jgi:hypothetical protein
MFVNAPFVYMMKMTIVEIIDVTLMLNRGMSATRAVHVGVMRGGHN